MLANPRVATKPADGEVIAKALLRASGALGLTQRELARVVGVSEATVSRFAKGAPLDPSAKEAELALLFLRAYRSLDALVGGHDDKARAWLRADNTHLAGVPGERIKTVEGLVHVAQYLDAMRGKL